jgi:hypothetical protein
MKSVALIKILGEDRKVCKVKPIASVKGDIVYREIHVYKNACVQDFGVRIGENLSGHLWALRRKS